MKPKLLVGTNKYNVIVLRVTMGAITIPLRIASSLTWRLETWRSRLQTELNNLAAGKSSGGPHLNSTPSSSQSAGQTINGGES